MKPSSETLKIVADVPKFGQGFVQISFVGCESAHDHVGELAVLRIMFGSFTDFLKLETTVSHVRDERVDRFLYVVIVRR